MLDNYGFAQKLLAEPGWKNYVASRPTQAVRAVLEAKLALFTEGNAQLFERARGVLLPFKHANKITSKESSPLSSYPPIVQALKNGVNSEIHRIDNGLSFNDVISSAQNIDISHLGADQDGGEEEEELPDAAEVHAMQEAAAAAQLEVPAPEQEDDCKF